MQVNQIRSSFLEFFERNNHRVVKSSPLIPHNDPSLMFTNSGMVQFKNYFTGVEIPEFKTATSAQKCVRAGGKHNDLENVGYTARHHTFFEMLGNFSFGDYFKAEAIEFAWNYLTKVLMINKEKLHITIFHEDEEAYGIWKKISGFEDSRIIRIDTSDNFWMMGETGPCGPCSEIFYDHGDKYGSGLTGTPQTDSDRYIEIWNLVFMQYEQLSDGSKIKLPNKSIDTGMGLERIAAVIQGTNNNYEIDLFKTLIEASMELSNNQNHLVSHRVIADHLRSCAFLIADGISPSNEGRGYVLRRIMRRAMRHVHHLGVKDPLMYRLVPTLISEMGTAYPELKRAEHVITSILKLEEERFQETLDRGLKLLNSASAELKSGEVLGGDIAFKLYDTYGFPLDLTKDILRSRNIDIDEAVFNHEMQEQKKRAKASWAGSGEAAVDKIWFNILEENGATEFLGYTLNESESEVKAIVVDGRLVESVDCGKAIIVLNQTPFYAESGGQVGDKGHINQHSVTDTKKFAGSIFGHFTEVYGPIKVGDIVSSKIDINKRNMVRANHSATHLLHAALRKLLGEHVTQKGSLVTADRLRFDFSHHRALSRHEIADIEHLVNQMIIANSKVSTEILTLEQAISKGAMALFGEKYDDQVRTVSMNKSLELCGGTHVNRTGDIGVFKIISEEAISFGIRRIEAQTSIKALEHINIQEGVINQLSSMFKCSIEDIPTRAQVLVEEKRKLERETSKLRIKQIVEGNITKEKIGNYLFIHKQLDDFPPSELREATNILISKVKSGIVSLSTVAEGRVSIVIAVSKDLTKQIAANQLIKKAAENINGHGGGREDFAQAGGTNTSGVIKSVETVREFLKKIA